MLELREGGLTATELTLNVSQLLTTFLQTYHSLNFRVTELDGQVKKLSSCRPTNHEEGIARMGPLDFKLTES